MKRRMVLVSTVALAGCSKYGEEGSPPAASSVAASAPPASAEGEVLVKAADVPVGGGTVITEKKIVVTQPQAGEFKAFSAVCTHQGCIVKDVSDGTINCPCHGSKYRVTDASVAAGPAPKPLAPQAITEKGGEILLA